MPIYALDGQAPDLPEDGACFVADSAVLIGRVRLKPEASIWFNAVLRGDNEWIEIGEGANVQEGSLLHTDPGFPISLGAGCTVGHHAIVHGCMVGPNSLIGMGATVLNGARIGANCLVGANALVTEGKAFPDNSLIVGAPARTVRTLDAEGFERVRRTAQGYVQKWRRYAAGLRRVD